MITRRWGALQVDLFASKENAKVRSFFFLQRMDGAIGADALAHQVLCFFSAGSLTSGSEEVPGRKHLSNSYCTTLAREIMVFYSKRTSCGAPMDTTGPTGPPLSGPSVLPSGRMVETCCLFTVEQLLKAKGFSNVWWIFC